MKLRVARHVKKLEPMLYFYCDLLGFELDRTFENHSGYSGVILNYGSNWEIEFTVGDTKPEHRADEDDLLVVYFEDDSVYREVVERFRREKYLEFAPKNPFWESNGKLFRDPEGFGVVVTRISSDSEQL